MHNLVGKSSIELIKGLPEIEWFKLGDELQIPQKLHSIKFTYYDHTKPKKKEDHYCPLDVSNGIDLEQLSEITDYDDRAVALMSKVEVIDSRYVSGHYPANIPMLDFDMEKDFNHLQEDKILKLIKEGIRNTLRLEQGVLIKSGPNKNYHYIGVGHLLDNEDFLTFLGLALTLRHPDKQGTLRNMVHPANIGHILTGLSYLVDHPSHPELETGSPYDYKERFANLRINKKLNYHSLPYIIDVL